MNKFHENYKKKLVKLLFLLNPSKMYNVYIGLSKTFNLYHQHDSKI